MDIAAPSDALCTVCNLQPPKYRCPSHPTIRTCSLPCYKRHQTRASCTGRHNPGATSYVKRSQLSTPSGIDRDFNFLTGIEKAVRKRAHEGEQDGGRKKRTCKNEGGVYRWCERNGTTWERAPVGMKRAVVNETRWLKKSGQVTFSVDWVTEGDQGAGGGQGVMLGSRTVREGWNEWSKRWRKLSRKGTSAPSANKGGEECKKTEAAKMPSQAPSGKLQDAMSDTSTSRLGPTIDGETTTAVAPEKGASPAAQGRSHKAAEPVKQRGPSSKPPPEPSLDGKTAQSVLEEETAKDEQHFYLHVPRCLSSRTVLTPIDPQSTLSDCLRNRRILEYPTVYVLPQEPGSLPADRYELEGDYRKRLKREYSEVDVDQILRSVGATVGRDGVLDGGLFGRREERLDEKRILEMLRRDVGV